MHANKIARENNQLLDESQSSQLNAIQAQNETLNQELQTIREQVVLQQIVVDFQLLHKIDLIRKSLVNEDATAVAAQSDQDHRLPPSNRPVRLTGELHEGKLRLSKNAVLEIATCLRFLQTRPSSEPTRRYIGLLLETITEFDIYTCDFENMQAGFAYANLREAHMNGADFSCLNLAHADFTDATLSGADFGAVNLSNCRFDGATLGGTNFQGASLHATTFSGALLLTQNFAGAHLEGADLTGAWVGLTEETAKSWLASVRKKIHCGLDIDEWELVHDPKFQHQFVSSDAEGWYIRKIIK